MSARKHEQAVAVLRCVSRDDRWGAHGAFFLALVPGPDDSEEITWHAIVGTVRRKLFLRQNAKEEWASAIGAQNASLKKQQNTQ